MLRNIRIVLATLFLACNTLLFIGIGQDWWGWAAYIQFIPSVMRVIGGATLGNLAILSALILLTLVFGRIYCSVICPLGVFQDAVIALRRKMSGKKKKGFVFSKGLKWMRLTVLVLTVASLVAGCQMLIALIGPYSAYGKMVRSVVCLVDGQSIAPALALVAGISFFLVTLCAWMWGRVWCNTVCPVGTVLGYVSKASLFKIRIDEDACTGCGLCGRTCKASCIDTEHHVVDYSRCVGCFDCIDSCHAGAISYSSSEISGGKRDKSSDGDRRRFLGATLLLAGAAVTAKAQKIKQSGSDLLVDSMVPKRSPDRTVRMVPPGAVSVRNFYSRCISCQLCVSTCPNDVLRPSTDLAHLLQPQMGFEGGFCRPECTSCSDVCPSGAILPISREEKSSIKTGTARVNADLCLAAKGEFSCGNCERHCPVGAISMVKTGEGDIRRPVVMEEICIGCGACEFLCPTRPVSAITVDGIEVHHIR